MVSGLVKPEATKPAQDLGAAILAMNRAKLLPIWDNDVPHKLHVELDVIFKALAALASPADALVAGDSETAKDVERLTCLKDVSTVELALEITLRNGPRFKCMGCKTYHNAPGKWDTCPCCGKKGYLCGSFEQDIESQDWRDWERRCIDNARQSIRKTDAAIQAQKDGQE